MKRTNLRIGCLLLVLVLLLSVLPVTALADEVDFSSNISAAILHDASGELPDNQLYDSYSLTWGDQGAVLQATGLKKHQNGAGRDGYWVGVAFAAPEDVKSVNYSFSTTGFSDNLTATSLEPEVNSNHDSGIAFYADAETAKQINVKVQWVYEKTTSKVETYTFNLDVELYQEAPQPPVQYTVYFDSMGGSPVESVTVNEGSSVNKPTPDPVKTGYVFDKWVYADGSAVTFPVTVNENTRLYAAWVSAPHKPAFQVDANFPSRVLVGSYSDVSVALNGVMGSSILTDASLKVSVSGPSYSDAELWYNPYGFWTWDYVDVADRGYLFSDGTVDELTSLTFPMSMILDKAGTYEFTFTLYDGNTPIAADTATVQAYVETHDDYRIYLDSGKHGSISTSPSTWADYQDAVIIYVNPDKGYELDTLKVYDARGNLLNLYVNNHGNYFFYMPNRSVTVYATFKEVNYGHFTDVPKDSWYYDAVYYVYSHDIMDGIGNRTFNPYGDLSRAMIVTTLYRLEGEPAVRTSGSFRDVPANTWYSDAVEWAAKEGIVKGYGKKTFGPGNSVTVEQLAAILQRYADYKGYDVSDVVWLYADAVVSDWAVNNVRWAAAEGLLRDGRSTNATKVATRAEIAYALYGFMVNVAK